MYSFNFLFIVTFGFVLIPGFSCLDEEKQNLIKDMADAIMACRNIVGMNLAIVQNGETSFTSGYGVIDLETNDPVTPETVFGLASLTKQFATTTLALALEENGLTWNTKVRDVLGENFFFFDSLRTSQATLKDMAAHRLAVPRTDYIAWSDNYTRHDEAYAYRFSEAVDEFRSSVLYNNNIYNTIGYITEVLTGQTWEDAVIDHIFLPANMKSTTFLHKADVAAPDFAKPYTIGGIGQPLRRVNDYLNRNSVRTGAGGSMASTAEDMAEWMKLQLNKGTLNGVRIVPEHIVEEINTGANFWSMTDLMDSFNKPSVPATYVIPEYGLGIKNGWYRDYKMLSHSGDIIGYHSLLTLLPDMDIGLFTAVTGADITSLGRRLFHSYVMDLLLGLDPWLNTTTACTFPEPWAKSPDEEDIASQLAEGVDMFSMAPAPPSGIQQYYPSEVLSYTGEYGNFYYGNITVYINETTEQLMLHYGRADPWVLLASGSENVFFGLVSDRMWPSHLEAVTFAKSDETVVDIDAVTVMFPRSAPATFIRGLKMSDAPPPPDPNACN